MSTGGRVQLAEAVRELALDAARDVDLARELERDRGTFPEEAAVAWDRAATSFWTLAVYCQQRRDEHRARRGAVSQ
jgi:hypothetical protein